MFGYVATDIRLWSVIEGVFSEKIVPENKYWSNTIAIQIIVPSFKESH
jgi:hypothetical protein